MVDSIQPTVDLLKTVRILRDFNDSELTQVLALGQTQDFEAHSNIVIEGELSWGIYLILSGSVGIFKTNKMTGESYDVGQLIKGNFFGEMSLIDREPRSASVRALIDSRVFYIDKQSFNQFLGQSPERKIRFYEACLKTVVHRLRETDENYVVSQYQLWKTALKKEAA